MTGLEILAVKGNEKCLFKVRHDGYAIEDYIALVKMPKSKTPQDAIKHFKDWFFHPNNYGPEGESDIETNFPNGYTFTSLERGFEEALDEAMSQIEAYTEKNPLPSGETFDDLCCSYGDYQVIIDLDDESFKSVDGSDYVVGEDN